MGVYIHHYTETSFHPNHNSHLTLSCHSQVVFIKYILTSLEIFRAILRGSCGGEVKKESCLSRGHMFIYCYLGLSQIISWSNSSSDIHDDWNDFMISNYNSIRIQYLAGMMMMTIL